MLAQNKKFAVSQDREVSSSFLIDLSCEKQNNPTIGREKETERMIEVLCRKDKNHPILVGDPGVGKTSVINGLVDRIKNGLVPTKLLGKKIYSLDISLLVNNLQCFRPVFEEIAKSGDILFIDEIHNIVGAGRGSGSLDLSNLMKPLLTGGNFTCIGATTFDEYQKYFEKDASLDRRFQKVIVDAPSTEVAIKMLTGLKTKYENFHGIIISDAAIEAAVKLSSRYIPNKQLPDKAIDLIDEASSRLAIRKQGIQDRVDILILGGEYESASKLRYEHMTLSLGDVLEVISDKTGIPVQKLNASDKEKLLRIEEKMRERVVGQDEAIKVIADSIITGRLGIRQKNSSFLFLGSTGVGKTECAKTLAEYLFDNENAMIRIDMSEYSEKHSTSKLIGAPAGYVGYEEGGQLTEAVRRKPYSVVLFDEVEKAHPAVFNLFLQMLDDNRLTDSQGRVVSFAHTIIIMTSNLPTEKIKEFFSPEFLNRIDEIVHFNKLTRGHIKEITLKEVEKLQEKLLESHRINLLLTDDLMDWIIETSYNEEYGARPLKRLLYNHIEVPVARRIIEENLSDTCLLLKR